MESSNPKMPTGIPDELSPKDVRNAHLIGLLAMNASLLLALRVAYAIKDETGISRHVTAFLNDLLAMGDPAELAKMVNELSIELNIRLAVIETQPTGMVQ